MDEFFSVLVDGFDIATDYLIVFLCHLYLIFLSNRCPYDFFVDVSGLILLAVEEGVEFAELVQRDLVREETAIGLYL